MNSRRLAEEARLWRYLARCHTEQAAHLRATAILEEDHAKRCLERAARADATPAQPDPPVVESVREEIPMPDRPAKPLHSKAEMRFLFANKPKIALEKAHVTHNIKALPQKVKRKKKTRKAKR
jgi:hypothetical protein